MEPALSLTLLATVGVQAYAAMRDRPVAPDSTAGTTLRRTEWVTLGLILTLNCWPALTGLVESFAVLPLLVHALGPPDYRHRDRSGEEFPANPRVLHSFMQTLCERIGTVREKRARPFPWTHFFSRLIR